MTPLRRAISRSMSRRLSPLTSASLVSKSRAAASSSSSDSPVTCNVKYTHRFCTCSFLDCLLPIPTRRGYSRRTRGRRPALGAAEAARRACATPAPSAAATATRAHLQMRPAEMTLRTSRHVTHVQPKVSCCNFADGSSNKVLRLPGSKPRRTECSPYNMARCRAAAIDGHSTMFPSMSMIGHFPKILSANKCATNVR